MTDNSGGGAEDVFLGDLGDEAGLGGVAFGEEEPVHSIER
jgi:hypothetical protein